MTSSIVSEGNSFNCRRVDLSGIQYESDDHRNIPHVLKFSGGRSSGLMLLSMLEGGLLNPSRGDVVIFNNTSAEHPATYEFVRKCTEFAEKEFGLPFFWIEFATYEDVNKGEWTRQPTFRIVNCKPRSEENPEGYHWRGEVFEELISNQGFVPNRHSRICTIHLKLSTTYRFLAEWFAVKECTVRRGHYDTKPLISDKSIVKRHRKSRGVVPTAELLTKKEFVRSRSYVRESQNFSDYSSVGSRHLNQTALVDSSLGSFVSMTGSEAVEYVSLIGLRADEPLRVHRVKQRNYLDTNDPIRRKLYMADGEIVATPLADNEIVKEDVLSFWDSRPWQLQLPNDRNLSNCVYCFMKGTNAIRSISKEIAETDETLPPQLRSVINTPSDIDWWVKLEEKYKRKAFKNCIDNNSGKDKVEIGFWGVDSSESYKSLRDCRLVDDTAINGINAQPCDCTD